MKLGTKEHHDLMAFFEKTYKGEIFTDKEPKELWSKGRIYSHGESNKSFIAFRVGYAFGKNIGREESQA